MLSILTDMSREPLLVVLGIVVAVAPFIGLPLLWLSILFPLCGLLVALIGFTLTRRKAQQQPTSYEVSTNDLS
mgnify:CR=1 FL=1